MVRHLLTLQSFSGGEILELIDLGLKLKEAGRNGVDKLRGKLLALIFEKPSTRTRVSLEVAMKSLGGDTLYLDKSQLQLSRGESLEDTARVLSRYVDAVAARVYDHSSLESLSKSSEIPVINALSDMYHPLQALCDLMTIKEKLGRLRGIKLAYVGDGNNVCNSLLIACSKVGADISVASPPKYAPKASVVQISLENASKSGGTVKITDDPYEAVKNADVIYTDTFVSMGMEAEKEERLRAFLPRYQVNRELMEATGKESIFMHCLPAYRGVEVTDEVIDGKWSVVWDQAENRLHSGEAVLLKLLLPEEGFKDLLQSL